MSLTHFAELQGLLQAVAAFEARWPHHPWRCWCGLCLHRRVRSGLRAGVGLGRAAWPRVAGQLAPGPLDPGKLSVLRPYVCALPPSSAPLLSFRVWQLVGAGLSMGTELPRWGSSLCRDGQGGPCVSAAAALSAGRVRCLLASRQHPHSELLDWMDWPRLPLVSLWREETTLVRGCLHA